VIYKTIIKYPFLELGEKLVNKNRKKILWVVSISIFVVAAIITPLMYFFMPVSRKTNELGQIATGGYAYCVEIEANLAYVLDVAETGPGGLVIINISDSSNPQILSSSYPSQGFMEIDVVGGIAYIADQFNGLRIVNVSDPLNPTMLDLYGSTYQIMDVQVEGDIAYVADWDRGLIILNISDPTNVIELDHYSLSGACVHAEISGSYAYCVDHYGDYSSLVVLDASDPEDIAYVGNHIQLDVDFWNPIVKDNLVYIGDHSAGSHCFHILDVENPTNIQEVGLYNKAGMTGFYIDSNHLFSANCDRGLEIYDITDPVNPKKIGRFDDGGEAYDVKVVGNIAYVADREDGLEIVELLF
jgi:hypothetical protein